MYGLRIHQFFVVESDLGTEQKCVVSARRRTEVRQKVENLRNLFFVGRN